MIHHHKLRSEEVAVGHEEALSTILDDGVPVQNPNLGKVKTCTVVAAARWTTHANMLTQCHACLATEVTAKDLLK